MGFLSESAIVHFYNDRITVRFRNHTKGRWFTEDDLIISTSKGNPHEGNRLEAPAITFYLPPALKPSPER